MNVEYHVHYSGYLNRNMELKRYGHSGKVIIVFPSSGGRFYEYEDFGMIKSIEHFIEEGIVQVFTIDSVDSESWLANHGDLEHKMWIAKNYENYLLNEFIPHVKHVSKTERKFLATGCSMGAYHALNFSLKHPGVFDQTIALSGIYDARFFVGEYHGNYDVYINSPVDYLWQLNDENFIRQYRENNYIISVGSGAFEEPCIRDMKIVEDAFKLKGVSGFFDYWGHDVSHDWVWWRIQMPYFLEKLGY